MTSKFTLRPTKRGQQYGLDWMPEPYQKQGVRLFVSQGAAGLFLDPGMRKTSISLAAIKILLKKKLVKKVLVIAPVRPCYLTWPAEIKKWKDFNEIRYSILHGSRKELALQTAADVYLMNPEGLPWLLNAQYVQVNSRNLKPDEEPRWKVKIDWKRFEELGFDMLILDESTKFKNTNTERFSLLRPILPKFNRRYILTGSPMPRSYMDLFGQIYTLDLGNALGGYITHYRNSYFERSGYGGHDWKLREDADKEIQEKLKPLVMHFAAEEHLDMPELRINPILVDLPQKARVMYDEMEAHLITDDGNYTYTAVNTGAAHVKCAQIANGGVYRDTASGRVSTLVHEAKSEAVADLIEELSGQPALVNYEFGHDLERLEKALGKNVPNMSGSNIKRLERLQDDWNAGEVPFMFGQPASMGHGLNLQFGGHHLIMHSLMWDWEVVDQWIRRLRRGGNKSAYVFLHLIIARGTIDEVKYAMMLAKDKNQREFLSAMKTYAEARKSGKFSALHSLENGVVSKEGSSVTERGGSREPKPKESKMTFVKKNKGTGTVVELDNAKFAKKGGAAGAPKAAPEKAAKPAKAAAKPAKTAKAAKPAKTAKALPAEKTSRGKYADKKIKVLSKEQCGRDGSLRAALMDAVRKAKSTNDVLGQVVKAGDKQATVSSADLAFAVEKGLISIS